MKILSIDPGYERLGIAVIEKTGFQKDCLVFSECFKTSSKIPHPERLSLIQKRIESVVEKYKPQEMATESLFFSNNQKTAFLVAEARGVIISVCCSLGLKVFEYGPGQIKLAVTGYGKSDKSSIIKMIPKLIEMPPEKETGVIYDDEFDAIAIGITHLAISIPLF